MSISLYESSIPAFIRALGAMSRFLEKGRAFADVQGIPHADLLEARLIEDMAPLTSQVQRASDSAKFAAARVGQIEAPSMPDTEATFDELQARIAATVAFLETVPATTFDGREEATVVLKTPNGELPFTGKSYLATFALPNFYFHLTTAYGLLRMKGAPIGKMDFLGAA